MQNFPGVHGLTLSNLIYYQKGLSQKSEIATTETLEHMVFEGKLEKLPGKPHKIINSLEQIEKIL